jgi:glutaredoxin
VRAVARRLLGLLGVLGLLLVLAPDVATATTTALTTTALTTTAPTEAAARPDVAVPALAGDDPVEITLYYGRECPKCEQLREWFDEVGAEYGLEVTEIEVWHDADNREAFIAAGEELGFEASSVPTTVLGARVWIGYTDPIREDIASGIALAAAGDPVPPGVYGSPGAGTCDQDELTCAPDETGSKIDVPFIGTVSLDDQSLLVSTIIIGFVDGVNPCSLWVISVLLTIVVRTASRRRVLAIGSTFLGVTAGMYALYMAGIYSALTVVGFLGWVQIVVAVAAGVFGVVSVKDYFAFKKGLSFTIPDSAKPGIYTRVRAAAGHDRLLPALSATVALGVAVSLLETPCTAGFPVLWTGLLQANGVGFAESALLFLAYMVPFLLDEMVVFGIAVFTMRAAKLQEKHGELLKLFAGVTMLALASVMVIDPQLMESPVKAALLFAAAFLLAWLVHVVTTRVRESRAAARSAARPDLPAV